MVSFAHRCIGANVILNTVIDSHYVTFRGIKLTLLRISILLVALKPRSKSKDRMLSRW